MKLEKFKKYGIRNKKIIGSVVGIILIICGVLLFKSFAFFESKYDFDVIKGRIPPFNVSDVSLAFTVDGVKTNDVFPSIDSGYVPTGVTCQNGVTAEWSKELWGLVKVNPNGNKKISCNVEFKGPYKEILLNGSYPVLGEEMIPITIGTGGVVTYADIKNEWYSYENKQWANAVILTTTGKTKNYTAGSTIAEADIESYFIWIPKYSYKIQEMGTSSKGQEKPFEIRFGTTNTEDNETECIAPNVSGQNGSCTVGKYMTHPAFTTLGEVKGLWVGKFETTGSINALTVKPNVTSLKNQNVSTFFKVGYNYKRNLDSHMMKNTEWGAMAYLTNSIYGKCNGTTCEEVYINNNSYLITGWSATTVSESASFTSGYAYSNANSVKASTTGNYYGIYDVSGGTWEYLVSVLGELTNGSGGFITTEASDNDLKKYYDVYTTTSRILGDATQETKGWFGDFGSFVYDAAPWYVRSGGWNYSTISGAFTFDSMGGGAYDYIGFRLVLAPL